MEVQRMVVEWQEYWGGVVVGSQGEVAPLVSDLTPPHPREVGWRKREDLMMREKGFENEGGGSKINITE